jgi:hypothetical protein
MQDSVKNPAHQRNQGCPRDHPRVNPNAALSNWHGCDLRSANAEAGAGVLSLYRSRTHADPAIDARGWHRSTRVGGVARRGVVVEVGDLSRTRAPALASQGSVGLLGWRGWQARWRCLGWLRDRWCDAARAVCHRTEAVQWIDRCGFGFRRVADYTSGAAHLCHG